MDLVSQEFSKVASKISNVFANCGNIFKKCVHKQNQEERETMWKKTQKHF